MFSTEQLSGLKMETSFLINMSGASLPVSLRICPDFHHALLSIPLPHSLPPIFKHCCVRIMITHQRLHLATEGAADMAGCSSWMCVKHMKPLDAACTVSVCSYLIRMYSTRRCGFLSLEKPDGRLMESKWLFLVVQVNSAPHRLFSPRIMMVRMN